MNKIDVLIHYSDEDYKIYQVNNQVANFLDNLLLILDQPPKNYNLLERRGDIDMVVNDFRTLIKENMNEDNNYTIMIGG